jgi:hypothetical protein
MTFDSTYLILSTLEKCVAGGSTGVILDLESGLLDYRFNNYALAAYSIMAFDAHSSSNVIIKISAFWATNECR